MFLDPKDYPFLEPLHSQWETIRREYLAVAKRAMLWPGNNHNASWRVIPIRNFGCDTYSAPRTRAAGSHPTMRNLSFSTLSPGGHIEPHSDPQNMIRGHLTLFTGPGVSIRVGEETRPFVEREILLFDEAYEHEVWNKGDTLRVTLMFGFDLDPAKGPTITKKIAKDFYKQWRR